MKKSKVYTRTGDTGETSLVNGKRLVKSDHRIDLYGEIDELNSRIGYACALMKDGYPQEVKFLYLLQSSLFDLGSNMACEFDSREKYKLPQLNESLILELESEIDRMDQGLEPLKNFILPGGSVNSSALHLARTCARAVERKLVNFENLTKEQLPNFSLIFLNRLSDYLFVLARYINHGDQGEEIIWKARN